MTEVFTRMFHDPHGKVFSLFLDTMIDLLALHKHELTDWLYVCLTRLLHKLGADLLGSLAAKVRGLLKTLSPRYVPPLKPCHKRMPPPLRPRHQGTWPP